MSKVNNAPVNVKKAYYVDPSGTAIALSYDDVMSKESKLKVEPVTLERLRNIHDGITEQTNGTFKIGYNLAQLTKGENPEYLRLGYPSIKALMVEMFDLSDVTGYAWADTASRFVEYDQKTGEYHSIFMEEFNGKKYDFTMSQLQEMRFPVDKKTGKEIAPLSIWKELFDTRTITVSDNTKKIRLARQAITAIVKSGKELTENAVSELMDKATRLSMTPEKALPYDETPKQETPAQGTPAQGTPAQDTPAQDTADTAQLDAMVFGAIEKAIDENAIQKMVMSSITGALDIYEKYIRSTGSTIVWNAIASVMETVTKRYTEGTPAQDAPAQDAPAQDAKKAKKAKSSK